MGNIRENLAARFMDKVIPVPEAGCWLWAGSTTKAGYGRFQVGRRPREAHRVSWELFVGDIGNYHVLHKCDVRSCVNPSHLFLGTHEDNMLDMAAKGRCVSGERHPKAKLKSQDVAEIRASPLSHSESCEDLRSWAQNGRKNQSKQTLEAINGS